jgi:hypothetical protein
MGRMKKPKQPPAPKYRIIGDDTKDGKEIRGLVKSLLATVAQHKELKPAKIAIAWMIRVKANKDGQVTLGKMKKASELDRELHGFDAVLILNEEHWRILQDPQRLALVDHELCHLAPSLDPNTLDQREDAHGRKLWRIRKHDLEEFRDVVSRNGLYKSDIADFVRAAQETKVLPLFPAEAPKPTRVPDFVEKVIDRLLEPGAAESLRPKPGGSVESVSISSGGRSVTLRADGRTESTRGKRATA